MGIGTIITTHRRNAALSIMTIGFGAMFLGIGLFLAVVVNSSSVKVAPEGKALVVQTTIGAVVIGALVIAIGIYLRRGGLVALGTEGVRLPMHGRDVDFRFADIDETCQMYRSGVSVGIAFRKRNEMQWGSVNGHVARYRAFRDAAIAGYLRARLPSAFAQLDGGREVSFRYVPLLGGATVLDVSGYTQVQTQLVRLDARTLVLPERTIPTSSITQISESAWTGNISLALSDGESVSLRYASLFEPELFLECLAHVIQR